MGWGTSTPASGHVLAASLLCELHSRAAIRQKWPTPLPQAYGLVSDGTARLGVSTAGGGGSGGKRGVGAGAGAGADADAGGGGGGKVVGANDSSSGPNKTPTAALGTVWQASSGWVSLGTSSQLCCQKCLPGCRQGCTIVSVRHAACVRACVRVLTAQTKQTRPPTRQALPTHQRMCLGLNRGNLGPPSGAWCVCSLSGHALNLPCCRRLPLASVWCCFRVIGDYLRWVLSAVRRRRRMPESGCTQLVRQRRGLRWVPPRSVARYS
jgi:hypothetical protein